MDFFRDFLRNRDGATSVEYAAIAGILTVVVLAASLVLRVQLVDLYDDMGTQANAALSSEQADDGN